MGVELWPLIKIPLALFEWTTSFMVGQACQRSPVQNVAGGPALAGKPPLPALSPAEGKRGLRPVLHQKLVIRIGRDRC